MAMLSCFVMQAKEKRAVTFVNEDTKSRVALTIRDMDTGKVLKKRKLSANKSLLENVPFVGDSFDFNISKDRDYAIEAQETGEDGLETGVYSLHLRSQDNKGTVRIVRSSFLAQKEKLSFVGNAAGDEGGASVRQLLLTPDWAKTKKS